LNEIIGEMEEPTRIFCWGRTSPAIENKQEAVHSGLFRVSNSDCTPL
jgi:hypothetical protein